LKDQGGYEGGHLKAAIVGACDGEQLSRTDEKNVYETPKARDVDKSQWAAKTDGFLEDNAHPGNR
jgi:hypothetical protein